MEKNRAESHIPPNPLSSLMHAKVATPLAAFVLSV